MTDTEEQTDDRLLQQLARIADARQHTTEPDVDAEWEHFKATHIDADETPRKARFVQLKMWGAALAGAAAMLIGVIFYSQFTRQMNTQADDADELLVMHHRDDPQLVTMSLGARTVDMSGRDSLNLRDNTVIIDGRRIEESGQMQSLTTPRGMDFKLILQDGTEVWLNAESTIDFPTSFVSNDTRRVNLKGEAYFKVAHDETKPFIVYVGDKELRVLGTEFDVRCYSTENPLVALVNGSIVLCGQGSCLKLKPGEGATWKEGDAAQMQPVDTYSVTQWVDGLFYFDEQSLDELLMEVARWYNVGVRFVNRQHAKDKMHFSASRTDPLEQLLEDLQVVCGYKIALEGNDVVVY